MAMSKNPHRKNTRQTLPVRPVLLSVLLACFLSILNGSTAPSQTTPLISVRLFEVHQPIHQLKVSGHFYLHRPNERQLLAGNYRVAVNHGQLQLVSTPQNHSPQTAISATQFVLEAATTHGIALQADSLAARRYPAQIRIQTDTHGSLKLINTLPKATYVAIVIGSETPPHWPIEALKAQAVLTQTRLLLLKPDTSIGDSTQQEVFLGLDHLSPDAQKATQRVWGQRLYYHGQIRPVYYHASCGGHTSSDRYFNPASKPLFAGVRCPYCKAAPFSKTTTHDIPQGVFLKAFPQDVPQITKYDDSGRAMAIRFASGYSESGYAFWMQVGQRLGWDKAPGTRFSLAQLPNGNIRIESTGAGHGVGLCQWGAATMARQGKSYVDILRFYFPQATLQRSP
jgi:stage II sporulation protein D